MSPARRRSAILMLEERLDMSERRACRIVGQHRSTQRRPVTRGKGDDALRARLHTFSRKHKRWGYRKAWAVLRDEGWDANRKKIQRLWQEEGLKVPHRKRKRQRLGASTCPATALGRSDRTTCGRSTSGSTRPQTAGS